MSILILPVCFGRGRKVNTKMNKTNEYAAKKPKIKRQPPKSCNIEPNIGAISGTTIRIMPIKANICAACLPE